MSATLQRPAAPAPNNSILEREVEYVPFMAKDPVKLSAAMVLRYLCTPTRSGKVCDERQAVRFVMLCKARGLNPWEGDAFLVGYDGQDGPQFSLITAHQAFLKRAETHPEFDGMDSGVIVRRKVLDAEGQEQVVTMDLVGDFFEDGDGLIGGWATVHFKSRKYPIRRRLKLATFNTGRSRWKADPAGMIVKCAEADALRSAFPNHLGGMYLEGEMPVITVEARQPPPNGKQSLKLGAPAETLPEQPAPSEDEQQQQAPVESRPMTKAQTRKIEELIGILNITREEAGVREGMTQQEAHVAIEDMQQRLESMPKEE